MEEVTQKIVVNNHKIATVLHDSTSKKAMIFCHGYRGTSVGPNRYFVVVARKLAEVGIASFRFDQYGSGNSEGDFFDSSFIDWVSTTKEIVDKYLADGFQVGLIGQSMGGATVIDVASQVKGLACVVAWVPDPNVGPFDWPENGVIEEGGQLVKANYWQEAHDEKVADKLRDVAAPTFIVQCTDDEYVNEENKSAIRSNLQPHHKEVTYEGYKHSAWTHAQADAVINSTVEFITSNFQ